MTDNDIIKALECCANHSENAIYRLTYQGQPLKLLLDNAIDLINRQKAEIKRLNDNLINKCIYLSDDETTEYCVNGPCPKFKTEAQIKAEAFKEVVKRFEKKIKDVKFTIGQWWEIKSALKEVEKEMVGDAE